MSTDDPALTLRLDPANPGHFFACCGLLELANRLWGEAQGSFTSSASEFRIASTERSRAVEPRNLLSTLAGCPIDNIMTPDQLHRRDAIAGRVRELKQQSAPQSDIAALEAEKKALDSLWREAPVVLGPPFSLRIDWFLDDHRTRGATFKTWAGQQSVIDIARGMQQALASADWEQTPPEHWLSRGGVFEALPFNFDSNLGGLGSDRDVGFSFDPLNLKVLARPIVELGAFIGLQRFRPARIAETSRFRYCVWKGRLLPEVAQAAACGLMSRETSRVFEFRLLYRNKYLKSFLPARQATE